MFQWKIFRSKWLAFGWLGLMSVLFFLPGAAFPPAPWSAGIYFDKWVHAGLFAILAFLWRSAFQPGIAYYSLVIFIVSLIYGFFVEVIQQNWIANRSFDAYDIVADATGTLLGLIVWLIVYKKNKPL